MPRVTPRARCLRTSMMLNWSMTVSLNVSSRLGGETSSCAASTWAIASLSDRIEMRQASIRVEV